MWGYLCVCVLKFVRSRMLVSAVCADFRAVSADFRAYIYIYVYFVYVLACIFKYLHIFSLSVGGKEWDEERECEKVRVGERGGCLFCGKFYWLMMMIKIKILITSLVLCDMVFMSRKWKW